MQIFNRFWFVLVVFLGAGLFSHPLSGKTFTREQGEAFVRDLAAEGADLNGWLHPASLALSQRLDIIYSDQPLKFLIQYDLNPGLKTAVRNGRRTPEFNVHNRPDGYSRLEVIFTRSKVEQTFYFRDGLLISPVEYHTRNWKTAESRYFRFVMSNDNNYNAFARDRLDRFVEEVARVLELSEVELGRLQQEKIFYALCDSTGEVEELSGNKVRGVYVLGFDQIVSTFNAHFHEVAHLLINYKLKELPLLTNPLLQEGFACAVGGRGGKAARVINDLGAFIHSSGFTDATQIMSLKGFEEEDPSISYPLAGILNRFWLTELGLERYLKLYRSVSGRRSELEAQGDISGLLPSPEQFRLFLEKYGQPPLVTFPETLPDRPADREGPWGRLWIGDSTVVFDLSQSLLLTPPPPRFERGFKSKEFPEIFSGRTFRGEQYLVEITANEIKLFDFYTGILDAFYSIGLTLTPRPVMDEGGRALFAIRRSCLPENLPDWNLSE
ncbi:MAG TPA: hypothetical protein PKV71_13375 [Calditrichia bacterium]|nr:hypothetical protein [Calditrichota bacterium]HQV32869.1 hypothetical protein [Calditrichia bacterium]